ncbi:MAG: anhydro-N-acetylmuramic acid kinase [Gemmatimonadales bacterium]
MTERPTLGVGLMSGTSLDGMDAALVRCDGPTHIQLLHFHTRPYSASERETILSALEKGGARELALLHALVGVWAAEAVEALLAGSHTRASDLSFIAMHGQTIWHEPPQVSWQLGEPAIVAERFGVRVVSGFRARDVAAGGQGAPLVPMADVLLFGHADHPRVLLNIGGMANFTLVPRRATEGGTLACDTGPGVAIIDAVARLVDSALPYDEDGRLARKGAADPAALARLLADPFFAAPPPKSTGREHFGAAYARQLHELVPRRRRRHRGGTHRPHHRRRHCTLGAGRARGGGIGRRDAAPGPARAAGRAAPGPGRHPAALRRPLLHRGRQGSGRLCAPGLPLHSRTARKPPLGDGRRRLPHPRTDHARMTLGRLAFPALRWKPQTGFSHEDRAIAHALELGVGGFIVFGVGGARADEIAAPPARPAVRRALADPRSAPPELLLRGGSPRFPRQAPWRRSPTTR